MPPLSLSDQKRSKTFSLRSSGIPGPLSVTRISAIPSAAVSKLIRTVPFFGVYLKAFDSMFTTIFVSLPASTGISKSSSSPSRTKLISLVPALTLNISETSRSRAATSVFLTDSLSVSDSSLLRSRNWSTSWVIQLLLLRAILTSLRSSGPRVPLSSSSERGPAIIVSGERNS